MTNFVRGIALSIGLVVAGGCAATGTGGGTLTGANADLIVRDEVLATSRGTAWEVVEYLRPQWLRGRSEQSTTREGGILIYVDDVRFGDLESLRTISAQTVYEMRRFSATSASQRWGPGHSDGVIAVSTRAGG